MSTENNNLPGDKHLSSLYKQAAQDMPPAQLDDAILAAARRETAARPHPLTSPFSGSWRIPASLAAVLVLSFGVVQLMDNEPDIVNGLEPFATQETEIAQAPVEMADKAVITEEKRALTTAPAKPAIKGRTVLKEEVTRTDITKGLAEKQVPASIARKKKQEVLVKSTGQLTSTASIAADSPAPTSRTEPVPTVEAITAFRIAGKLEQANLAADVFIRHYFADDIDTFDPSHVKLTSTDLKDFIVELRKLERQQQADKLEGLMSLHQNKLGH